MSTEFTKTMDDLVASTATVDVLAVSLGVHEFAPGSRLERAVTNWGKRAAMGVLDGYWTLERMDQCHQPGAQCSRCEANAWRVANGLTPDLYRNPAREWIAAHPEQWEALLRSRLADEIATPDLPPAIQEASG
jgi:hypothetical protein